MDLPVPSKALPISSREKYEKRIIEWGEKGPALNVNYKVQTGTRTTIIVNDRLMPVNSMEQQKKRTFT